MLIHHLVGVLPKDLGGADIDIYILSRSSTSTTRTTFEKYVLGEPETVQIPAGQIISNNNNNSSSRQNGTNYNSVLLDKVAQNDGAITYTGASGATSYAQKNSGVVVATIDGNAPTASLVKSNAYKFWNIGHMYTKGKPQDLAQAFIDYMTSSDALSADSSSIDVNSVNQAAVQSRQ